MPENPDVMAGEIPDYGEKIVAVLKDALCVRKITATLSSVGESMYPLIKEGDILVIKPVTYQEIRGGQIAVFAASGRLYCHRLIYKYKRNNIRFLVTKGDIALIPDYPVEAERLLGRVALIRKHSRTVNLETFPWQQINLLLGIWHTGIASAKNVTSVLTRLGRNPAK